MSNTYWLPTIGYTLIDAINRVAAATGSPRYAQLAENANYNGHRVTVSFNTYRGYWIAEYFWAGRNVLARGELKDCLRAAREEYKRGAKGTTVYVVVRDEAEAKICEEMGYQPCSDEIEKAHAATYRDPRFEEVSQAFWYDKHFSIGAVGMLANSATVEEYKAKLEAAFEARKAAQTRR